jgi:hypothetical protein
VAGKNLRGILNDKGLAQLGDSLVNFAYSVSLTEKNGRPVGTMVSDKTLAEAAVKAGLRESLPRRVGRGDVANSLEALVGFVWLERLVSLDEILECLRGEDLDPSQNFARLAELALARVGK